MPQQQPAVPSQVMQKLAEVRQTGAKMGQQVNYAAQKLGTVQTTVARLEKDVKKLGKRSAATPAPVQAPAPAPAPMPVPMPVCASVPAQQPASPKKRQEPQPITSKYPVPGWVAKPEPVAQPADEMVELDSGSEQEPEPEPAAECQNEPPAENISAKTLTVAKGTKIVQCGDY